MPNASVLKSSKLFFGYFDASVLKSRKLLFGYFDPDFFTLDNENKKNYPDLSAISAKTKALSEHKCMCSWLSFVFYAPHAVPARRTGRPSVRPCSVLRMSCEFRELGSLWLSPDDRYCRASNYCIAMGEKTSVYRGTRGSRRSACGPNENLKDWLSSCR